MSKLTRRDLRFTYAWSAGNGDDPTKTKQDAYHLSRSQGYEMLPYLNSLKWQDGRDFTREERIAAEWMIKVHFKSTAPSRATVTRWVYENFDKLAEEYLDQKE
ncbi:hypothetical protein [Pseudomonas sp. RIT-PI-S]|uniref:hypothetical protein n=1 Tax=Pseudomonas sp. RIT-PI-S TaxID=3035295 RepID=UPI0021DB0ADF|nr:hypothetical protein [Pseudomonas sp. RIT-PI-S]